MVYKLRSCGFESRCSHFKVLHEVFCYDQEIRNYLHEVSVESEFMIDLLQLYNASGIQCFSYTMLQVYNASAKQCFRYTMVIMLVNLQQEFGTAKTILREMLKESNSLCCNI